MASNVLDNLRDEMVISCWHISIRNGMKPADLALADMHILEAADLYRDNGPISWSEEFAKILNPEKESV